MTRHAARTERWVLGDREITVISVEVVHSTTHAVREMAVAGLVTGPTLFRADRQSGGYGRFGRPWHSPLGGLWITLAWPTRGDAGRLIEGLGLRVGAACLDVILSLTSGSRAADHVRLKWPNDVLIESRKVCGCLCEWVGGRIEQSWLLLGVGINANNDSTDLPSDLRRPATSLRQATGKPVDLEILARDLTERLIAAIEPAAPCDGQASDSARRLEQAATRLWGLGEPVIARLPDGARATGALRGLSGDGRLILEAAGFSRVLPHGSELD